jgi:hypothetical protein
MRFIFSIVLLALAAPCLAQTAVCPLKFEEAPEVRGFKLGQSFDEVRKILPLKADISEKDELGLRTATVLGISSLPRLYLDAPADWPKRMEGVDTIWLRLLDDKLVYVAIRYDDSTKWPNPLEFTAAIAASLSLPKKGWYGVAPTRLDCAGFFVETYASMTTPMLIIKLRDLEGELVTRKYEAQRKKREKFKP